MKKGIIIGGIITLILLLRANKGSANNPTIPMTETFFFPPVNQPEIRIDSQGDGNYNSSRDGGTRNHAGIDLVVYGGESVYSPIEGIISRYATPYPSDLQWKGIVIEGIGKYTGHEVKIFYCSPEISLKTAVYKGDWIARAQSISKKYSPKMIDHLHIELRIKGKLVDPTPYFINSLIV